MYAKISDFKRNMELLSLWFQIFSENNTPVLLPNLRSSNFPLNEYRKTPSVIFLWQYGILHFFTQINIAVDTPITISIHPQLFS